MAAPDDATRELPIGAYAAFNARDIDGALATMRPDVTRPDATEDGYVHGHDAVRGLIARMEIGP